LMLQFSLQNTLWLCHRNYNFKLPKTAMVEANFLTQI